MKSNNFFKKIYQEHIWFEVNLSINKIKLNKIILIKKKLI